MVWGVLPPRLARRLTVASRIIRKAQRGWVHGARQAKMQRRQRKDALSRGIHGLIRAAKVAGRIGKRRVPAVLAAGAAAVAATKKAAGWLRNRGGGSVGAATPATPFAVDNAPKTTEPNSSPATLLVSHSQIGAVAPTPIKHNPQPETTEGENDMNTTTATTPRSDTELTDIHAVKERAARITDMANDLVLQIEAIRAEGVSLGEDYEATDWGTTEIDTAVTQIVEHTSTIPAPTDAIEATMAAVQAVAAAAQIGETAAEHGARGRLEAFTSDAA